MKELVRLIRLQRVGVRRVGSVHGFYLDHLNEENQTLKHGTKLYISSSNEGNKKDCFVVKIPNA